MPASVANDLRSEARSYQRDKNHNTKWAHGSVPRAYSRSNAAAIDGPFRPAPITNNNHGALKNKKFTKKRDTAQASTLARKVFRNELDDARDGPLAHVTDNSSDEDLHDAIPAQDDYLYSYDAPAGPAAGRDILSAALNKAVIRFENTETEKLVTREYDVIDQLKEGYTADEDEDDYELITEAHLK